jgi:hypothetical protein
MGTPEREDNCLLGILQARNRSKKHGKNEN